MELPDGETLAAKLKQAKFSNRTDPVIGGLAKRISEPSADGSDGVLVRLFGELSGQMLQRRGSGAANQPVRVLQESQTTLDLNSNQLCRKAIGHSPRQPKGFRSASSAMLQS
jgi:hypothetical protein